MENIKKILSENLKSSRKERGLTQEALAESAGVSLFTIQAYESGRRWPELEFLDKIAGSLGVDTYRLFQEKVDAETIEGALKVIAESFGYSVFKIKP